jgi:hypothetical protein
MRIGQSMIIILSAVCLLTACNKDSVSNTGDRVGMSKITYYPEIATVGDRLIILSQGASYSDAGAKATVNGTEAKYETAGNVNTATPGIYVLQYTAVNSDGFSASDFRTVVVIGNDVAANDFSGTYARDINNITSTWTKTANGVYTVDNPGGAASGVGYKVVVVNYTGNKITIPRQIAVDPSTGNAGVVSSSNEVYSGSKYQWVFLAGGYGTGVRTFIKQ